MTIAIGAAEPRPGFSGRLLDCHDRIRSVLAIAGRLTDSHDASAEEVRAAAERVRRYFAEALPLHVLDEDETLVPRLRGLAAGVDAALARMSAEHVEHEADLAGLVAACTEVVASPDRERLEAALVTRLSASLESHLSLEEAEIIPAIADCLSANLEEQMTAEAVARRAAPGAGNRRG